MSSRVLWEMTLINELIKALRIEDIPIKINIFKNRKKYDILKFKYVIISYKSLIIKNKIKLFKENEFLNVQILITLYTTIKKT